MSLKKFQCKFDGRLENKFGTPNYIRGSSFDARSVFHSFEVLDIPVSKTTQMEYLDSIIEDDGGWVAFACGLPEMCRMFAFEVMARYHEQDSDLLLWHRVTSSRYDELLDNRNDKFYHLIVVDSLLTHPKMHPSAFRAYDPSRIGKVHDIASKYRGRTSVLILCPELTPEEAYKCSMIQADQMFYLKPKAKDVEL